MFYNILQYSEICIIFVSVLTIKTISVMAKKLYYTVEKETENIDSIEECTGNKTITVYEIEENEPKTLCQIESYNHNSTINEIKMWLSENSEIEVETIELILL
jgi:hypothetical protein